MKTLLTFLILPVILTAGCTLNEDIDPNFYMVTTNGIKTVSGDDSDTDSYTLSFITNNNNVVSGYVSGPGIPDTSMIKYTYNNGIWTDADGNDRIFQHWRDEDGYRDMWEAFVDTGNEVPVPNRKYSMNLTLGDGANRTETVFIRGFCEYAPEIMYPLNGAININAIPEFYWSPPSYEAMIIYEGGTYPVTEYVYARGYMINLFDDTGSVIWTCRIYDTDVIITTFNNNNTALTSLQPGLSYRLELRFIDYGFNSSSDEVTFTIE